MKCFSNDEPEVVSLDNYGTGVYETFENPVQSITIIFTLKL